MIRYKESPLDFNAVNSLFSERFPKVIMDESKIANGSARGIKLADIYNNNSRITNVPSPFPMRSSRYFQKNCMTNMNMEIARVTRKGPAKDRMLKT
jgi:hypothetical protein